MTDTEKKVEEVFENEELKKQAEDPASLEAIGKKLDEALETKGTALGDYIDDLKICYEMIRDPEFQIDRKAKIYAGVALLYLISPIDLIPDVVPVIGLLDDVLVVGFAMKHCAGELARYREFRATRA